MVLMAKIDEEVYNSIYQRIIGIVFFGTPFRGTHGEFSRSDGWLLSQAEKLHRIVYYQNYSMLQSEDHGRIDLLAEFHRATASKADLRPRLVSFFEQKETDIGRLLETGVRYPPLNYVELTHLSRNTAY
jgi:hypothetical protein